MGRNTAAIWISGLSQYLLITAKAVAFEKVSFSDTENPKAVFWHIDSRREGLSAY